MPWEGQFSLCFPFKISLTGEAFDELLHAVSAVPLHLIGHMAVDIQGENGRSVPQVFLYGFNVVTPLDGGHGITVPEIVETGGRETN